MCNSNNNPSRASNSKQKTNTTVENTDKDKLDKGVMQKKEKNIKTEKEKSEKIEKMIPINHQNNSQYSNIFNTNINIPNPNKLKPKQPNSINFNISNCVRPNSRLCNTSNTNNNLSTSGNKNNISHNPTGNTNNLNNQVQKTILSLIKNPISIVKNVNLHAIFSKKKGINNSNNTQSLSKITTINNSVKGSNYLTTSSSIGLVGKSDNIALKSYLSKFNAAKGLFSTVKK